MRNKSDVKVGFLGFELMKLSFLDSSDLKVKKKSPKKELGKNARITLLLTVSYNRQLRVNMR